jgi:hypothetical protein
LKIENQGALASLFNCPRWNQSENLMQADDTGGTNLDDANDPQRSGQPPDIERKLSTGTENTYQFPQAASPEQMTYCQPRYLVIA